MEYSIDLLVNLFLVSLICILVHKYFFWYNTYWEDKNVPYVEMNSIFKLLTSENKSVQDLQIERRNKLGRLYGYYENNRPVLCIAEPELLKDILVRDFKFFSIRRNEDNSFDSSIARMINCLPFDKWRRLRPIISPSFSVIKLKKYMNIFTESTSALMNNFKNIIGEEHTEITRFYRAFTVDIIASTAFSVKIDSLNDPKNEFVINVKQLTSTSSKIKLMCYDVAEQLFGSWIFKLFSAYKNIKFFENAALQIIQQRKETGMIRNDFLQSLINTSAELKKYDNSENSSKEYLENFKSKYLNNNKKFNEGLTMKEITAQCVFFFMAGYRTTTATLSFTTYLLGLHPDIQEKVYQEIISVLPLNNAFPTFEDLQKMKYLDNVISESLRVYPPTPVLERVAGKDYELGNTGVIIPKGMRIRVPTYSLHRDPDLFPEPNKFDPDRFHEDNQDKLIPYSYLPFGTGPRNCMAYKMALLEIKLVLVHLLRSFRIKACPETKVPLEFSTGRCLVPFIKHIIDDIKVKIEYRNDKNKE